MTKYKELIFGGLGSAISSVGLSVSAETIDHIVSIICASIGLLITIITCLLIPLIKWIKKATKDGKIDETELDELSTILDDGKKAIDSKNQVENKKKGE